MQIKTQVKMSVITLFAFVLGAALLFTLFVVFQPSNDKLASNNTSIANAVVLSKSKATVNRRSPSIYILTVKELAKDSPTKIKVPMAVWSWCNIGDVFNKASSEAGNCEELESINNSKNTIPALKDQ